MNSTLIQSQIPNFIAQNYDNILTQSFNTLIDSLHRQNSKSADFSELTSIFYKLLQTKADPPLETIWVYSKLAYLSQYSEKIESLDRFGAYFSQNSIKIESLEQFGAIKELFQLIVSFSGSCNPLKCIVLIAPVIYNLHKFIVYLKGCELGNKREKRLKREVKSLVGSILGYLSVCCEGLDGVGFDDFEQTLIRPLGDLVSVWVDDKVVEEKAGLVEFFPLLSSGVIEELSGGLSEISGFVVAEAFLLRLCLEFGEGELSKEGQNQLRSWIIGSITGLKNSFFYRTLVMMLLEPSLPLTSLVDHRAQTLLRKMLYDAVLLVEYTFLAPDKMAILPIKHVKGITLSRLMLIHEAVESLRKEAEDQPKVLSYLNAFSSSSLPSQLIKWVRCESGIDMKANGPNGTSPKAFLKWILNLENRGLRIFDDGLLKYRNKLILDNLVGYPEEAVLKEGGKSSDADVLFYIDKKGAEEVGDDEDEDMTSTNAAFMTAAQAMQSPENGSTKRKAKDAEKQLKYLKYGRHEHSDVSQEKPSASVNDDSSSDSEVDNPSSDEDMEA
ncbi:hypothetical protein Leryth_013596 [Lithospermum erythrorhizon]|nr:hypothetical protein Leryth_013596 [Lithospermum erythrorhizon]